jgi:hypothetical protein
VATPIKNQTETATIINQKNSLDFKSEKKNNKEE